MSNYNPYAAPAPAPAPAVGIPPGATVGSDGIAVGPPQPWAPGETTALAWQQFQRCWGVLVATYFVSSLIAEIPQQAPLVAVMTHTVEKNSQEYWIVYGVSAFLGFVVQMFFQPGLIKIWVSVARGGSPGFGELLSGVPRFLPLLACTLLSFLAMCAGYLLLFVPGVIVGLGLALSQFYVVDAQLGPIEAMRASWQATKGHKANIFLFSLIGVGLMLLGLLMCCIGMYATFPIFWVGLAIVYVRLSGRGWASAGDAAPGPPGQWPGPGAGPGAWGTGAPPGGYGGPAGQGGYPGY